MVLLSNTNQTHLSHVLTHLKKSLNIVDFDKMFFDKTIYSHQVGMRKPEPEIFLYLLNLCRFLPEQTLFIDDNKENLKAASALGINTIWHPTNADLKKTLDGFSGLI